MSGTIKAYRTYEQQVELLEARGMDVGDQDDATAILRRINYYRLSGYWYPFRQPKASPRDRRRPERTDNFFPGTRLADVVALYEFDGRLRAATFSVLSPIELAMRALLGDALGRIDPCAHLKPELLGRRAEGGSYTRWLAGYEDTVKDSREDFVTHHVAKYGGVLPVWAAVDVLDWGGLTYLYGFAPDGARNEVADACGLTAPQLASWLKALNLVRNTCAHHGRLFNRVHTITPKLPPPGLHADLDAATTAWNRTFGQLTLIQFLLDRLNLGRATLLPAVVKTFPTVRVVPLEHLGAPYDWQSASRLWH